MAKNPRTARFDLPIVFPGPFSGKMRGRKSGLSLLFCWSERRDLNPGPPVPQTGALTGLRYAPPGQWPMLYAARSGRARAAAGDGQVGFRSGRTRPHRLEIEAMVSNRDIGFVRAGDRAEIKVDTQFHPVRAAARRRAQRLVRRGRPRGPGPSGRGGGGEDPCAGRQARTLVRGADLARPHCHGHRRPVRQSAAGHGGHGRDQHRHPKGDRIPSLAFAAISRGKPEGTLSRRSVNARQVRHPRIPRALRPAPFGLSCDRCRSERAASRPRHRSRTLERIA